MNFDRSILRAPIFCSSRAARACSLPIPKILSRSARAAVEGLGVEVRTSTLVTRVEPERYIWARRGFDATVILWAAGVAASPLGKKLGVPVDRAGRVPVATDLSVPGHPEIFVIGDLAAAKRRARKDASRSCTRRHSARKFRRQSDSAGDRIWDIRAHCANESTIAFGRKDGRYAGRPAFHYWDKGSLATIGRAAAVAQFGKIHISGFMAWLSWLFVHILFLIGFRNRLLVFIQWAWSYVTYERSARLITGSTYLPGWTAPIPAHERDTPEATEEIHADAHK